MEFARSGMALGAIMEKDVPMRWSPAVTRTLYGPSRSTGKGHSSLVSALALNWTVLSITAVSTGRPL